MNIQSTGSLSSHLDASRAKPTSELTAQQPTKNTTIQSQRPDDSKVREAFTQFVGETFFGQLIKSMRSSLGKPAYFHGGRAEEVFQGQLDQMLSEQFAKTSADEIAAPMYELFQLQRRT